MQFPNDGYRQLYEGDPETESDYEGLRMEVMGLASVMQYKPGPDEVVISIWTKHYGWDRPDYIKQGFVDGLWLEFDDTEIDRKGDPDAKPYTHQMAKQVAEFVLKHKDKKKLVIHCFAGMSRSRSMAAGIVEGLERFHDIELPYRWSVLNKHVASWTYNAFRPETNEVPDTVYERNRS